MMVELRLATRVLIAAMSPQGFNVGMNIDLMPVTGVPLPFLSYGGSFVLSCFLLLGLVQSVHRHSAGGGEDGGSPATGLTA